MKTLAALLRGLGTTWLVLAGIYIALTYLWIVLRQGFAALQDQLSPFNIRQFITVLILLGPGLLLRQLADGVRLGNRRTTIRTLILLPVSLALFALAAWVVVLEARRDKTHEASTAADERREYKASAIRVKNHSATMLEHKKGWITTTSGPVGTEGIPDTIRLDDVVSVKGRTIRVRHIFVTEYNVDLTWKNQVLARKGDIKCTIVESEENIPGDTERDRLWVRVNECEPLN